MVPDDLANDDAARRTTRHFIAIARTVLFSRAAFRQVLPVGVCHDPGLEALLILFVAEEHCLSRGEFDAAMTATGGSTRWAGALEQLGLVALSSDYVMLSDRGREVVLEGLELVMDAQARRG